MKYLRLINSDAEIDKSLNYGVIYATDDKVIIKECVKSAITKLTYNVPNGGTFPIGYNVPSTAKLNGEVVTFTEDKFGHMTYTAPSGGTYVFEFENIGEFDIAGDFYDENHYIISIEIGNDVTSIGWAAFKGCQNLTSVIISNNVTSIGSWAFASCENLTSITILDSVTEIGYMSFNNCSSLTSVPIPNNVTSIDDCAFYYCIKLASVTYNGTAYTSKSALESALTSNNVTVGSSVFNNTALSA